MAQPGSFARAIYDSPMVWMLGFAVMFPAIYHATVLMILANDHQRLRVRFKMRTGEDA